MSTNRLSAKDIRRQWHLIDAKNEILGRLATQVARILMGKNKPVFVPYQDLGDNVVIINAARVATSGRKEEQKQYIRHSGYPGGLKSESLAKIRQTKPEQIIFHAVKGMLPKNRLGKAMIKRMHIFPGSEHPFDREVKDGGK